MRKIRNKDAQADYRVRVVSTSNLRAMCAKVSGMCHRYKVEQTTDRFAYVSYSNPDEFGRDHPVTARFPIFVSEHCTMVVLEIVSITGIRGDYYDHSQDFDPIILCSEMFKDPATDKWMTREEAVRSKGAA